MAWNTKVVSHSHIFFTQFIIYYIHLNILFYTEGLISNKLVIVQVHYDVSHYEIPSENKVLMIIIITFFVGKTNLIKII